MFRVPRGVMMNVLDCNIVADEFKLQSRYYIQFQINTLRKGKNRLIFSCYRLNSATTVQKKDWFGIR